MNSLKFLIAIVLFSCLIPFVHSQTKVTLVQGETFKPEKNAEYKGALGGDDEIFYILRIKKKGVGTKYFVEAYDKKSFAQKFSVDLALDAIPGAQTDPAKFVVNSIAVPGKVYVFLGTYFKDVKEKEYLLISVDKNGAVSKEKSLMKIAADNDEGKFQMSISPDRKKIALVSSVKYEDVPQEVNVSIHDAVTFEQIKKFQLPKSYGRGSIFSLNYIIDNTGSFYFSFNYLNSSDQVGLAIGMIPAANNQMKTLELNLGSTKEVYNGLIKFNDHDNSVTIAGMFRDIIEWEGKYKDKPERKMGFFSYKIKAENFSVIKKTNQYFNKDVYNNLKYYPSDLPGDKYFVAEDIFAIGKDNYFVASHSYTVVDPYLKYDVSNEIIVVKITDEGDIDWMKLVPKFTSVKVFAFNSAVINGKLHFLYLEHPQNLKWHPDIEKYNNSKRESIRDYAGTRAVCVSIDSSGKMERNMFYENYGMFYLPNKYNYLLDGDNGLLMHFIRGSSEMFGKVVIK